MLLMTFFIAGVTTFEVSVYFIKMMQCLRNDKYGVSFSSLINL